MAAVFGANARKPAGRKFEIRLDSPFAVFYGEPHEADPVDVHGSLVLSNLDHMSVRSIKIRLVGKWRVSWFVDPGITTLQIRDRGTAFEEEVTLYPTEGAGAAGTHKIAPGCHEWRFKFTLDPSLPESVEGLPGNYVVYDLSAEIDRGYMSKNLTAEKHLRVIRTLGRDQTDTVPLPYSNEDTWRDKVWYNVYLPTRYYIYGTSITAEFTLCPLHKGVTVGRIRMEVVEKLTLSTDQGRFKMRQIDTVVASHEQALPEDSLQPRSEETTGIADESHHFKVTLPLERSLTRARQTVETDHIKVWHSLRMYVNLHNPDGHVSQLVVRNQLHLYLSPNLPIGDDQTMRADPAQISRASDLNAGAQEAPPTYGRHQLDMLYDDIDPGAFVSGGNTPANRASLSRNPSDEDLRDPDEVDEQNGSTSASDLSARLAALEADSAGPGRRRSSPDGADDPPRSHSTASDSLPSRARASLAFLSRPLAGPRRSSAAAAAAAAAPQATPTAPRPEPRPHPQLLLAAYDMDALARIPSYNTAVRTPLDAPPDQDGLPTYATAVSTPASPAHAPRRRPSPRSASGSSSSSSVSTLAEFERMEGLGRVVTRVPVAAGAGRG